MAAATRKMVLNRTLTLDTLFGHSIRFEKGQPTNVPPICQHAALAIGAEFADGEGVIEAPSTGPVEPLDPVERANQVLDAVSAIAEKNDTNDFTAAGIPKVGVVCAKLGYTVSSKDIAAAWQARHDAIAAAKLG